MIFHELGKASSPPPPVHPFCHAPLNGADIFATNLFNFQMQLKLRFPLAIFTCYSRQLSMCVCVFFLTLLFVLFLGALFFCFLLCALFVFAFQNENSVLVAVAGTAVAQFNSRDKPILNVIQLQHKCEVKDIEGQRERKRER